MRSAALPLARSARNRVLTLRNRLVAAASPRQDEQRKRKPCTGGGTENELQVKREVQPCPNYNSRKELVVSRISARGIATIDWRLRDGPDLFGDGLGGEAGAVLLGLEREYSTTLSHVINIKLS